MTEFKWQVERWLQSQEWVQTQHNLQTLVKSCAHTRCSAASNKEDCLRECERPWVDFQTHVREKTALYVRKGCSYCKGECWESSELPSCVQKCVGEYSLLFDELRSSLLQRAKNTRVLE